MFLALAIWERRETGEMVPTEAGGNGGDPEVGVVLECPFIVGVVLVEELGRPR